MVIFYSEIQLGNAGKYLSGLMLASLCMISHAQTAAIDLPYPGQIELTVDATNNNQKIYAVHETVPVRPGALTLLYPQWLPGEHSPTAQLAQLAEVKFLGNRQRIEWQRDPINVYAFHLVIPEHVNALDIEFNYLAPISAAQGDTFAANDMSAIHWEKVVLYPSGYGMRGINVKAQARIPSGWQFASALEQESRKDQLIVFKPTDLEDLVDSPFYAGKYAARFDLDPGAAVPVFLDVFADEPEDLAATPEQIEFHRALLQQAYRLFGAGHFRHFDFLVAASDHFTFAGLEHHQSSENGVKPNYFTDWNEKGFRLRGDLIPHEFTHSWDGKFRRPAGQLTSNLNQPMQNDLLWVYEGQTQYWGYVLAARSGLLSVEQVKESIAMVAASYVVDKSKLWRSVQETTNDPVVNQRRPLAWRSVQGQEDYYTEGQLIWLDVDTRIRELSHNQRSLNDFAHRFFGVDAGRVKPLTYTFDDVINTLNQVEPYDWAHYLRSLLDSHGPGAPLEGLTRSGWKLVFTDKPGDYNKSLNADDNSSDFWYSLGFVVGQNDRIGEVLWDGPAFKAGLTPEVTLMAVNGREYKEETLKRAIVGASKTRLPIELLIKKEGRYQTLRIDYVEGLKYPHLEAIPGAQDRLADILAPLK